MDAETDLLMSRILMWVGIVGVAVTLVLEYLGVFGDWGIILSALFGLVGVLGVIKGATRAGVEDLLRRLLVIERGQERTNALLERIAAAMERLERKLPPSPGRDPPQA